MTVKTPGRVLTRTRWQQIFEPFYTTKSTGMGMGLSISRSILQSHGGRLWATAKDGPGTIFHFSLRSTRKKDHMRESLQCSAVSRSGRRNSRMPLAKVAWRSILHGQERRDTS